MDSQFFESLNLAKLNLGKTGTMFLFDVSFFASFYYIIPLLFGYIASKIPQTPEMVYFILLLSLGYYIIIIAVYSFFKYSLLEVIRSLFEKKKFSFSGFWGFCLLNMIIIMPTFFLFSFLIEGINAAYRPWAFIALGMPVSLLLYIAINAAQSSFYQNFSVKKSFKLGIGAAFGKIKNYKEQILALAAGALALWLLFLILGFAARTVTSGNYSLYLKVYAYLTNIEHIVLYLAMYFIVFVNRISFYKIVREMK
jgi:hypothetical protein